MPLFDMECLSCREITEVLRMTPCPIVCPKCGSPTKRLFTRGQVRIIIGYPLWVDRIDYRQKKQEDRGITPTLPHYSEVAY